jgi:hypothetical protein
LRLRGAAGCAIETRCRLSVSGALQRLFGQPATSFYEIGQSLPEMTFLTPLQSRQPRTAARPGVAG